MIENFQRPYMEIPGHLNKGVSFTCGKANDDQDVDSKAKQISNYVDDLMAPPPQS